MDLEKIAPIIEKIMKKTLEEKRYPFGFAKFRGVGNKVASGKLRDSVEVNAIDNGSSPIIEILILKYAQWVQSGRLPGKKGVPIDAIEQWIKSRKLQGRDKKGRYMTHRNFAFAIQSNIKKFGIRPANFYDVLFETIEQNDDIMNLLENEAYEDLINAIEIKYK